MTQKPFAEVVTFTDQGIYYAVGIFQDTHLIWKQNFDAPTHLHPGDKLVITFSLTIIGNWDPNNCFVKLIANKPFTSERVKWQKEGF